MEPEADQGKGTWGRLRKSGVRFYQDLTNLDAFGLTVFIVILTVQVISAAAILILLVKSYHYLRTRGLRTAVRLILDALFGSSSTKEPGTEKINNNNNDKMEPSMKIPEEGITNAETRVEVEVGVKAAGLGGTSDSSHVIGIGSGISGCPDSCNCCRARKVISTIFLGNSGSGDKPRPKLVGK
jgi:hypothetical protein